MTVCCMMDQLFLILHGDTAMSSVVSNFRIFVNVKLPEFWLSFGPRPTLS